MTVTSSDIVHSFNVSACTQNTVCCNEEVAMVLFVHDLNTDEDLECCLGVVSKCGSGSTRCGQDQPMCSQRVLDW